MSNGDAMTSDDVASRRRAAGAAVGLLLVVVTYGRAGFGADDRQWAAGVAVVLAVLLADQLDELRALLPVPGVAPLTIVAALVAVWLCVPETDQLPVAALLPGAVVALELVLRRQVGVEWYALAAASVGWAGLFGASGRQSALIGALFAFWAVALVPLVHMMRPIRSTRDGIAVAIIGAAAAFGLARTGGIADSSAVATLAVVAFSVVSFGLAAAVVSLPGAVPGDGGDDS